MTTKKLKRLRESKRELDATNMVQGHTEGRDWAMDHAEYVELDLIVTDFQGDTIVDLADFLGCETDYFVGPRDARLLCSTAFATGFIQGLTEVYEQVD